MRKILYSPEYGAGWTSWEEGDLARFMVDYPPIVEYVENGGTFDRKELDIWDMKCVPLGIDQNKLRKLPNCLQQFLKECQEKFGRMPGISALRDIKVMTVNGPVRITDHDGYESVEQGGGEWL